MGALAEELSDNGSEQLHYQDFFDPPTGGGGGTKGKEQASSHEKSQLKVSQAECGAFRRFDVSFFISSTALTSDRESGGGQRWPVVVADEWRGCLARSANQQVRECVCVCVFVCV